MSEKFARLSMCNCLTVRMDKQIKSDSSILRTYTLHQMTPSVFLKVCKPGFTFVVPYVSEYNSKFPIKKFIFPIKIKTFLLSTFNEYMYTNYKYKNGKLPYVNLYVDKAKNPKNFVNIGKVLPENYEKMLADICLKIDEVYKPKNKILIFYDHRRAPSHIKKRAQLFNKIATSVLDWPVIQIKEGKATSTWNHYTKHTYIKLYNQICEIESGV